MFKYLSGMVSSSEEFSRLRSESLRNKSGALRLIPRWFFVYNVHVFECSCFFSSVSMSLYMIHCTDHFIRCNFMYLYILFINWKKKKKKISRIILYIESRLKLHKICKRSIIMYRNWDSYFVFLLLNCIKKVRANSIPKNYHRNAWCVCRVYHLLIL